MSKYRKIIAKNIEELMEASNLGKSELCKRAGIDRTSLNKYLEGTVSIGSDAIESIAEALKIEPHHLWKTSKEVPDILMAMKIVSDFFSPLQDDPVYQRMLLDLMANKIKNKK